MSEKLLFGSEVTESVDSWEKLMFLYNSALKEMKTRLEIIQEEFKYVHQYNPIEYFETRMKTPESILKKIKRYGYEPTMKNMVQYIKDIAGVRIVCSFEKDVYRFVNLIKKAPDFNVLEEKNYIANPKPSGYRSYHMIVEVPVSTSEEVIPTVVEIQIRTIAMDFWASLEHKIYYKFEGNAPAYISEELQDCAYIISKLDDKMMNLHEAIQREGTPKK